MCPGRCEGRIHDPHLQKTPLLFVTIRRGGADRLPELHKILPGRVGTAARRSGELGIEFENINKSKQKFETHKL